ncbi:MAG TPA: hypothetical protein VFO31_21325, partial [Vicinamibacterales bacterium]|nr:hypothetical protein [Vicinamibacterales bacterium]
MAGDTAAVALFADQKDRDREFNFARKNAMMRNLGTIGAGAANIAGDLVGEHKRNAAVKDMLVNQMGADPAEADNAIAIGWPAVQALGQKSLLTKRTREALGLMGFDATAGMGPGMADKFMGVDGAPAAPAAPASRPQGMMGGVPFGPTMTPPAPASPLPAAATAAPMSRQELFKRYLASTARDAGSLHVALGMLPEEPKPMTDEDRARAESLRAQGRYYDAQAGAIGQPKPDNEPDNKPLTAEQASLLGVDPQFVGKVTYANAKDAVTLKKQMAANGQDVDLATIMSAIDAVAKGQTIQPGTKVPSNIAPGLVSLAGQQMRAKGPTISDTTAEILGVQKGTTLNEVKLLVDKMLNDAKSKALSPGEMSVLGDIREKNLQFISERGAMAALKGPDGQLQFPNMATAVQAATEQNQKIDAVLMKKISGPAGLGDVPPPPAPPPA